MPSPKELDLAVGDIIGRLTNHLDDPSKKTAVNGFIQSLIAEHKRQAHRLIFCMGIDMACGALHPDQFCEVILHVISKYPEAGDRKISLFYAFGDSIRAIYSKNIACSSFKVEKHDKYVHVISVRKFGKQFQTALSELGVKLDDDNVDSFYEFLNDQDHKITVSAWKNTNSAIFVAHENDFHREKSKGIHHVLDALGLIFYNSGTLDSNYLALHYPEDVASYYQPCTLNGDWGSASQSRSGNPFFLTYHKEDDYGRTFSVSGSKKPVRERVHAGFISDTRFTFKIETFPAISDEIPSADETIIINEAYERYQAACKP